MKIFALALALLSPGPAAQNSSAGTYEVIAQSGTCYIDARFPKPNGVETQIIIFASSEGYAFYIGRTDWDHRNGAKYNIDVMFYDPDWNAGSFEGEGMPAGVVGHAKSGAIFKGWAVGVTDNFVDALAQSRRMLVSEGGVIRADINLQGAGPYVARLRRCVAAL